MIFWTTFRNWFRRPSTPLRRSPARDRKPRVEILEDRLALSTLLGPDLSYDLWRDQRFGLDNVAIANSLPDAAINQPLLASDQFPSPSTQASGFESLIGLDQAFANYNYRGQGYSVAVLDTGIDYRHAALGGSYGNRVIAGWDFVNNDADPLDDNGHGTHVAGIIGSSAANYPGVAPNVNLIALKVLGADGSGSFGHVEDALRWVINNRDKYNIVAVNLSLGAGNFTANPYTFLEDEFATLKNNGVFIAAASGNSFYSYSSQVGLGYPAISPLTVSVGAVWNGNFGTVTWASGAKDNTTAPDRVTSFTQRSSGLNILAPGALITNTHLNNTYKAMAGTSMATPVVAGAAALIHQALVANGQGANANQDYILNVMRSTGVTVVDGDDENDNVANTGLSFKRLDLFAALQSIQQVNQPPTLAAIANQSLNAGSPLVVALNGSDANGDPLTYSARVLSSMDTQAFNARQQFGLQYPGDYYTNAWGRQEKYMYNHQTGVWYFIQPNGELRRWVGNMNTSLNAANLLGTFEARYYNDPSFLWNAQAPSFNLSIAGNQLTIQGTNIRGSFTVEVTVSDGKASAARTFTVAPNNAPTLGAIPAQTMAARQDNLTLHLAGQDADGDSLTYGSRVISSNSLALQLDQQHRLRLWDASGSYYQNVHGMGERWLYGDAANLWYCLLPNGQLRRMTGDVSTVMHASNLIATLDGSYWLDPRLLWDAAARQDAPPVNLSLAGNVLTLDPAAGYAGTFVVEAWASDGRATARQFFTVTVAAASNQAPQLGAIADQTMATGQISLVLPLTATDADGDVLSYAGRVVTSSSQALQLQQNLKLKKDPGGYFENAHGMGERWLYSESVHQWYCILPSGELRLWTGNVSGTMNQANLVASLDGAYWTDPALLWNASAHQAAAPVTVGVSGNQLTVTPAAGFAGTFVVEVSVNDGIDTARRFFRVTVPGAAPTLAAIPNQTITLAQGKTTVTLDGFDADGDPLSYSARFLTSGSQAVSVQNALKLRVYDGNGYYQNSHGMNEKWLYSDAQHVWYCLLPNGELRRWGGSVGATMHGINLAATLDASYWNEPALLWNAVGNQQAWAAFSVTGNKLTITPNSGRTGTFQVEVTVSDGVLKATRTFFVTVG